MRIGKHRRRRIMKAVRSKREESECMKAFYISVACDAAMIIYALGLAPTAKLAAPMAGI